MDPSCSVSSRSVDLYDPSRPPFRSVGAAEYQPPAYRGDNLMEQHEYHLTASSLSPLRHIDQRSLEQSPQVLRSPRQSFETAAGPSRNPSYNGRYVGQKPSPRDNIGYPRRASPVFQTTLSLPSATFAWAPLLPASRMEHPPRMYVDYTIERRSDRTPQDKSLLSQNNIYVPQDHKPEQRHRTVSTEPLSASTSPASQGHSSILPIPLPNEAESDNDDDQDCEESEIPADPHTASKAWEEFARDGKNEKGRTVYICTWQIGVPGHRQVTCGYKSRKPLVKRHIEATHLKLKPFVCRFCFKRFPQKSSLKIHESGHTNEKPHLCEFGCGEAFKDPARRIKHHFLVHKHQSKVYKKRFKPPSLWPEGPEVIPEEGDFSD